MGGRGFPQVVCRLTSNMANKQELEIHPQPQGDRWSQSSQSPGHQLAQHFSTVIRVVQDRAGKKGERRRHVIHRRAPWVHRVPETCLVKTSVSQGKGKVGLVGVWPLQNRGNARYEVSFRKLAEIWTADGRTTQHLSGNLKTSQALFIIVWQKHCQGKSVQCFPWPSAHKQGRSGDKCGSKRQLGLQQLGYY